MTLATETPRRRAIGDTKLRTSTYFTKATEIGGLLQFKKEKSISPQFINSFSAVARVRLGGGVSEAGGTNGLAWRQALNIVKCAPASYEQRL